MASLKRIEPTGDEARNGWTPEALAEYVAERDRAAAESILNRAPVKPATANGKYRPLKWRG